MNRPKVVGITGTIASGKSLVGKHIADKGFTVIDTDRVVHELMDREDIKRALIDKFGDDIVGPDGKIDRTTLGAKVWGSKERRRELEAILHPATIAECEQRIIKSSEQVVFLLVPLLFEAAVQDRYNEVWSVRTDETVLRQRLKQRNNLTDEEISQRLAAQLSQEEKARRANVVIDNSGTISNTTQQVDKLLEQYQ